MTRRLSDVTLNGLRDSTLIPDKPPPNGICPECGKPYPAKMRRCFACHPSRGKSTDRLAMDRLRGDYEAIRQIAAILKRLDDRASGRVLRWLVSALYDESERGS